jgi:hypothetical protein
MIVFVISNQKMTVLCIPKLYLALLQRKMPDDVWTKVGNAYHIAR